MVAAYEVAKIVQPVTVQELKTPVVPDKTLLAIPPEYELSAVDTIVQSLTVQPVAVMLVPEFRERPKIPPTLLLPFAMLFSATQFNAIILQPELPSAQKKPTLLLAVFSAMQVFTMQFVIVILQSPIA